MSIINTGKVCGFGVVRKPEANFDSAGRGAYASKVPQAGTIFYGGIDRMPWFDIREAYYNGTLPAYIQKTYESIQKCCLDFTGIELCQGFEDALMLLECSNHINPVNELIAVYSEKLAELKGTINIDPSNISMIGYDIVAFGWWSLLCDGYFMKPAFFSRWAEFVNASGLLSSADIVDNFVKDYEAAVMKGAVEELPELIYGIEAVEIGRVCI